MVEDTKKKTAVIYYIDNRRLYDALCNHRKDRLKAKKAGKDLPRIPTYVAECIMLLCKNIGTKACFSGYSYLEEMIGDGMENCIMYGIKNFNPKLCYPDKAPTPYSYFTQIITWAFLRRIEREKTQHYIKLKNSCNHIVIEQLNDNRYMPPADDAANDQFIKTFEDKLKAKKEKRTPVRKKKCGGPSRRKR